MTPEERGNRIALRQKPDDNLANCGGIIRAIQDAIAEEREACAKIADARHDAHPDECDGDCDVREIAIAIRART